MVDEGVSRNDRPVTGFLRPQAIIIIVEATEAESFVQQADLLDELAANQKTEPDQSIRVDQTPVVRLAPVPSEAVHPH